MLTLSSDHCFNYSNRKIILKKSYLYWLNYSSDLPVFQRLTTGGSGRPATCFWILITITNVPFSIFFHGVPFSYKDRFVLISDLLWSAFFVFFPKASDLRQQAWSYRLRAWGENFSRQHLGQLHSQNTIHWEDNDDDYPPTQYLTVEPCQQREGHRMPSVEPLDLPRSFQIPVITVPLQQ